MAGREKEVIYHHAIADRIRKLVRSKVKVDYILSDLIERYENPPQTQKQLYRVYGNVIKAARAEAIEAVGDKIYQQATEEGHFPSQELYLTSQEDWSKKDKIQLDVVDDEDNSAIGTLLALLGKDSESTKT